MLLPFLNTDIYSGSYCTESAKEACAFLRRHQVMIFRLEDGCGAVYTDLCTPPQRDVLPLCRLPGDALYAFYVRCIDAHGGLLRPTRAVYSPDILPQNLLTLCQRNLFLERERACCFVRPDLCFHALPLPAILAALGKNGSHRPDQTDPIIQELCLVHQARYDNLMLKTAPTYFVLSRPAMRAFAETGLSSDRLYAMRPFTCDERRRILQAFLKTSRDHPQFHVHVLKDDSQAPSACFASYEDMGVQISVHDPSKSTSHGEALISLPAFAEAFSSYCLTTLIPELCLSEEESAAFLAELLAGLDPGSEA